MQNLFKLSDSEQRAVQRAGRSHLQWIRSAETGKEAKEKKRKKEECVLVFSSVGSGITTEL